MSDSHCPPPREPPVGEVLPGKVRVILRLAHEPATVWPMLTEAPCLARWFGDLAGPLRIGADNRLEFGDGDFFTLRPTSIVPGRSLAFDWRFLGVGNRQSVLWTLGPAEGPGVTGSVLTVEDHDDTRGQAEASQLREGWTDFLTRLGTCLDSGRDTRYQWRDDIDGSVDLPAGPYRPLRHPAVFDWLPIAFDGFRPAWFFTVDDEGPRRFAVNDWRLRSDEQLAFTVEIPGARIRPACHVALVPVGKDTVRLSFVHRGWARLGLTPRRSQELRGRFAAVWVASLEAVAARAGSPGPG
ncbi:SRPBCC domain-containing protein [Streptomyces uncialis]|uniref:SRPBCC family protein n=1 Tax=Streptomyces uncialis TaxID=1048205 RepID=UPI0037F4B3C9